MPPPSTVTTSASRGSSLAQRRRSLLSDAYSPPSFASRPSATGRYGSRSPRPAMPPRLPGLRDPLPPAPAPALEAPPSSPVVADRVSPGGPAMLLQRRH